MAAGSATVPLMDGSSEALKCTYQNKGHRTQSEKLANSEDLLPEQQSYPFFRAIIAHCSSSRLNMLQLYRPVCLKLRSEKMSSALLKVNRGCLIHSPVWGYYASIIRLLIFRPSGVYFLQLEPYNPETLVHVTMSSLKWSKAQLIPQLTCWQKLNSRFILCNYFVIHPWKLQQ